MMLGSPTCLLHADYMRKQEEMASNYAEVPFRWSEKPYKVLFDHTHVTESSFFFFQPCNAVEPSKVDTIGGVNFCHDYTEWFP